MTESRIVVEYAIRSSSGSQTVGVIRGLEKGRGSITGRSRDVSAVEQKRHKYSGDLEQ